MHKQIDQIFEDIWAFSVWDEFDRIDRISTMLHLISQENNDYVCGKKTNGWSKLKNIYYHFEIIWINYICTNYLTNYLTKSLTS